jgi:ferredoxin
MDSTKKLQIWIESSKNEATHGVFVDEGLSLLENLIENNVEIDHSCGGFGTCGTCCVKVVQGIENFSPVNEIESEMKIDRGMSDDERLCCQSFVSGSVKIKIP